MIRRNRDKDNDTRVFEDIARVAGGAASLLSAVRDQIGAEIRGFQGRTSSGEGRGRDDDDLARLHDMISKFRVEQEALKKRVAALEDRLAGKAEKSGKAPRRSASSSSSSSSSSSTGRRKAAAVPSAPARSAKSKKTA